MNQTLLIVSCLLGGLLFITLICLFFISRKSQRVMHSLLEIITHPEQTKLQSAVRILDVLFKDEISKIDTNFKNMSDTLRNQIERSEQIKTQLSTETNNLVGLADEATKKIANMAQRLENTINDLQNIVSSSGWVEIHHTTDQFSAGVDELLNKIQNTTTSTSDNALKIQEQITQCIDIEQQISDKLQSSFNTNTENMDALTKSAENLQQQLTNLGVSVTDGFTNVKNASTEYDETMHKNDKLLSDYLTKMTEFSKRADKELVKQVNTMTETANVVGARVRLSESSIDKQIRKLESVIEALNNSTNTTKLSVSGISTELSGLTNRFNSEIHDFSTSVVKELQEVSGVANTTLESTKVAATEFADSVKNMGVGVRETLIEMNKAHTQLSGQSESLIQLSKDTTEQLKPLSELIERYYKALPDLSQGSKDISDNLNTIVNDLVDKINTMRTTINESLTDINQSSVQLGDLAGQSRQEMIDLMSDYAKAVEAMQSLHKQMMVARAAAPMDAIKVAPVAVTKPLSTKDFLGTVDTIFNKLYEQSVDLTRAVGADIPNVVWKKYNDGDNKIFAKWLVKMFAATDKKQIHELLKSDNVFQSQAAQFMRNFEKILDGAEQTNDATKVKNAVLKSDLGTIYTAIKKSL
ncbi:MAG: methyl-accepting chemotaxis protein [Alphaproteobacteria bacterium]|nr:methyl-accepting chemotaxis protein [Alphaproteobacteria bacterium]